MRPERVKWGNRVYHLTKFGFVHTKRRGLKKFHIFTFSTGTLDMCVELDADNLHYTLLAVVDGRKRHPIGAESCDQDERIRKL